MRMNIPNQITLGRLLLTFVFFGLLTRYGAAKPETHWILATAFWIYLVAALIYFLMSYPCSVVIQYFERRASRGHA